MTIQRPRPTARRRIRTLALVALLAVAQVPAAVGPAPALAGPPEDAVLDWNLHALEALTSAPSAPRPGLGQPPPVAVQHLAMVQTAVYDAVNLIDGGHEPYLAGLAPAPPSASHAAAVATAAHDVLVGVRTQPALPPAAVQRLRRLRDRSLAAATSRDGHTAVADGVAAGRAAAEAMLDARADDGRYGSFRFTESLEPGGWRATSGVNDPNAWVARVRPFTLLSTSQFRTKGPRAMSTGAYAREYQEVKDYGGDGSTTPTLRTPEQTALARFYTVHPVEMFNRAFRGLAAEEGLTLVEQARLFAMLNTAGADALIGCWDDKAFWSFWRPETAIRGGADDGNRRTEPDPTWTSLVAAPPYPDHPSGFTCVTSALMHTAEAVFGNHRTRFRVTALLGSPPVPVTREYERFRDVVADTVDARVYLGIHFRSADVQGAELGKRVAHWVRQHHFRPVRP